MENKYWTDKTILKGVTEPLLIILHGSNTVQTAVFHFLSYNLYIWGFTSLSTLYRSYHDG